MARGYERLGVCVSILPVSIQQRIDPMVHRAKVCVRGASKSLFQSTLLLLLIGNTVLPFLPFTATLLLALIALGLGTALWKTRPAGDLTLF